MNLQKPFKNLAVAIALLSITFIGYAQPADVVVLKYQNYTSWFSKTEHIPIVVEYTLTESMLQCNNRIPRAAKFTPDPNHKDITNLNNDYKNSGYDRGHNMNADDNKCDATGMKECFYFSNMTPQPHSFNAGRWEDLEKLERMDAMKYEKVIVTIGSIGKFETIGTDNAVVVPKFMWKVIYIPSQRKYNAYMFPDKDNVTEPLESYKVDLSHIEQQAGITFTNGKFEFDKD